MSTPPQIHISGGIGKKSAYLDDPSLEELLSGHYPFTVPEYQRGYEWESKQITDYVKDLGQHAAAVQAAVEAGHEVSPYFFGAVITVRTPDGRAPDQLVYEVVDGQQRLTTFYLTLSELQRQYRRVGSFASSAGETGIGVAATNRADDLETEFLTISRRIQGGPKTLVRRLVPAGVDQAFFDDLMKLGDAVEVPPTAPVSHSRLREAMESIRIDLFEESLKGATTPGLALNALQLLDAALLKAAYVIHAGSGSEPEAYRLFLVLNDRGKELTEADLLRTRTMEVLRNYPSQQRQAAENWTHILSFETAKVRSYLRAFYALSFGVRAPSKDLHREFQSQWLQGAATTSVEADRVVDFVRKLDAGFDQYRSLAAGTWPYHKPTTSEWHQSRLKRLVSSLRQDASIPLLMAASKGDEAAFSQLVFYLERFAFAYGQCGGHASSLADAYFKAAFAVRSGKGNGTAFVKPFLADVRNKYITEEKFRAGLNSVSYGRTSTMLIKYLLTTLDDFFPWVPVKPGAQLKPSDETSVFSLTKGDIDHIYPQTPESGQQSAALDHVKHSLGNLAFLAEGDNRRAKNKPFKLKRERAYKKSKAALTRDLAVSRSWPSWTPAQVRKRQAMLVDLALEVFAVD